MEILNSTQSTTTAKPAASDTSRPQNASATETSNSAAPQTSAESKASPLPPVETTSDAGNGGSQRPAGESQTGNQVDLSV